MTLVASWFNFEPNTEPSIWTAADTQISDGNNVLTLEGCKVFELPVVCKHLNSPQQPVYHRSSLGFAYAGSTITAINTYATLSSVLCNLGSGMPYLPDYESIVEKALEILKLYTTIEKNRKAEISIWGFCPQTKNPFIAIIKPEEPFVDITLPNEKTLQYVLLGDAYAKVKIVEMIDEWLKKYSNPESIKYWRAPIYPLREIINTHIFPDKIGGNIQLAQLNQYQYHHLAVSHKVKGTNRGVMKYRNIDLDNELSSMVGNCLVAINGYMLDLDFE